MADIEEKIAKVFDLFEKHGNELYIGKLLNANDLTILVVSSLLSYFWTHCYSYYLFNDELRL